MTLLARSPEIEFIQRSAWKDNSKKFAKKVSKIVHVRNAHTPIEEYAATATCVVEAQDGYLPS